MTPGEIAALCPDLPGAEALPLGAGSDSEAWLVGGRVVVKLPRHATAAQALAREARVLELARRHVTLPLPDLRYFPGPPKYSRHELLPGAQLLAADYDALDEAARQRLAQELARFHAECHGVPVAELRSVGAGAVQGWPDPGSAVSALARLPKALRPLAGRVLDAWARLSDDPLGEVWGHFDSHGWNMAFDHQAGRLAGIYDFGDSGFGPLHRDLIYSALISFDLTRRLGRAYSALTARAVDQQRLWTLSGAHRLWELAEAGDQDRAWQVTVFERWAAGQ